MTPSRRRFCAIALSAGGVSITGCLNDDSPMNSSSQAESQTTTDAARETTATRTSGTTLSLNDITASPGESGHLTLEARNVKWIGLPNPFDGFGADTTDADRGKPTLNFERMTADPRIEVILESYPPQLQWSSLQRHVTVKIAYRVPKKSPTREYPYTVTASKSPSGGPGTATKSALFTVAQE